MKNQRVAVELKKLEIIQRTLNCRLRRFPHAYEDRSDKINCTGIHNYRAALINRIEEATDYAGIVKFDEAGVPHLYDRQEWLNGSMVTLSS